MEKINEYNVRHKSYNRNSYIDTKYGFSSEYINKDFGVVSVDVTQDGRKNYYVQLYIFKDGYDYHRTFEVGKEKPTHRWVGLKSKAFLNYVRNETEFSSSKNVRKILNKYGNK